MAKHAESTGNQETAPPSDLQHKPRTVARELRYKPRTVVQELRCIKAILMLGLLVLPIWGASVAAALLWLDAPPGVIVVVSLAMLGVSIYYATQIWGNQDAEWVDVEEEGKQTATEQWWSNKRTEGDAKRDASNGG